MRVLRVLMAPLSVAILAVPATSLAADQKDAQQKSGDNKNDESIAARKAKLDEIAKTTMNRLFTESSDARALFDRAYGYAVFDNSKVSLGLSGAGGSGVAVWKAGGGRTYMKMGSGGVGVGAGYQEYQVVFLFENQEAFDNFVREGWTADASATAVGGKAGASAAGDFSNGIALFKLNERGLALNADVSGTRYWKDKKLNK